MLVIGLDAASHNIIEPNLEKLPNLARLIKKGSLTTIKLTEDPVSHSVWCSMFSGLTPKEHEHTDFRRDAVMKNREDLPFKFVWDILSDKGLDVRALQVPFLIPPYNFRADFKPTKNGLSPELEDLEKDLSCLTQEALAILKEKPDLMIVVFTMLDRLSHFHWGTPLILEWYKKLDNVVGQLTKDQDNVIVVSDHGFCSWKESKTRTLKRHTPSGREVKGDHSDISVAILSGLDHKVTKPQDIYQAILKEFD